MSAPGYTIVGFTDDESAHIIARASELLWDNPFLTEEQAIDKAIDRLGLIADRD